MRCNVQVISCSTILMKSSVRSITCTCIKPQYYSTSMLYRYRYYGNISVVISYIKPSSHSHITHHSSLMYPPLTHWSLTHHSPTDRLDYSTSMKYSITLSHYHIDVRMRTVWLYIICMYVCMYQYDTWIQVVSTNRYSSTGIVSCIEYFIQDIRYLYR